MKKVLILILIISIAASVNAFDFSMNDLANALEKCDEICTKLKIKGANECSKINLLEEDSKNVNVDSLIKKENIDCFKQSDDDCWHVNIRCKLNCKASSELDLTKLEDADKARSQVNKCKLDCNNKYIVCKKLCDSISKNYYNEWDKYYSEVAEEYEEKKLNEFKKCMEPIIQITNKLNCENTCNIIENDYKQGKDTIDPIKIYKKQIEDNKPLEPEIKKEDDIITKDDEDRINKKIDKAIAKKQLERELNKIQCVFALPGCNLYPKDYMNSMLSDEIEYKIIKIKNDKKIKELKIKLNDEIEIGKIGWSKIKNHDRDKLVEKINIEYAHKGSKEFENLPVPYKEETPENDFNQEPLYQTEQKNKGWIIVFIEENSD